MKKKKWQLVEEIVASLFDSPDVVIEKNKRLNAIRRSGRKGGTREIDVLISGKLAGQQIYIPIECKDLSKKVGSPEIDAFIGKLLDVGLPTQMSIYVATGKFTQPAISRASEVGMKTLRLNEKNPAENASKFLSVIQSKVFVLCSLSQVSYFSDDEIPDGSYDHLKFYDRDGNFHWILPDILWSIWHKEFPYLTCGNYMCEIDIPEKIMYTQDGKKNSMTKLVATFNISALVYREKGLVNYYNLQNAESGDTERWKLKATFSEADLKQVPIHVDSEEKLNQIIKDPRNINIIFSRVKLPKIVMDKGLLWPPSKGIVEHFNRINPAAIEQEKEKIVKTEMNNFWDFDDRYTKQSNHAPEKINVTVKKN